MERKKPDVPLIVTDFVDWAIVITWPISSGMKSEGRGGPFGALTYYSVWPKAVLAQETSHAVREKVLLKTRKVK